MSSVTVFIPVFNEEALLEKHALLLCRHLDSLKIQYEVLIGSNGSTDRSPAIGKELSGRNLRIKFFHLPQKGPGLALKCALDMAQYENFVTLDMDLSSDMSFIEQALKQLEAHDIVVGSKIAGSQERPWIRKAGSAVFVFFTRMLLGLKIADYSIGTKAFKTSALKKYRSEIDAYTAYILQILFRAKKDGLKITEIGVKCVDTRGSRFNLIHEGGYKFYSLFKIWLRG